MFYLLSVACDVLGAFAITVLRLPVAPHFGACICFWTALGALDACNACQPYSAVLPLLTSFCRRPFCCHFSCRLLEQSELCCSLPACCLPARLLPAVCLPASCLPPVCLPGGWRAAECKAQHDGGCRVCSNPMHPPCPNFPPATAGRFPMSWPASFPPSLPQRWNQIVSNILRACVYDPIMEGESEWCCRGWLPSVHWLPRSLHCRCLAACTAAAYTWPAAGTSRTADPYSPAAPNLQTQHTPIHPPICPPIRPQASWCTSPASLRASAAPGAWWRCWPPL